MHDLVIECAYFSSAWLSSVARAWLYHVRGCSSTNSRSALFIEVGSKWLSDARRFEFVRPSLPAAGSTLLVLLSHMLSSEPRVARPSVFTSSAFGMAFGLRDWRRLNYSNLTLNGIW